jgi:hypothetical protein
MSNKPTVLVTGGAGYIGSHAVLALTDAGWPVVVVDNLSTGFRFAIPDGVPLIEADIGDQAAVEAVMRAHEVKAVMHFAGSIVVPESVENPLKYYHNNTVNSRALIESAVRCGVPHFIFSSTMKKIEAIIKPFKLDEVKEALQEVGVSGHHRDRSQGLWPPEGPYRALSRRRICRRFPAQGEARSRGQRRRLADRVVEAIAEGRADRPHRRRQDFRLSGREAHCASAPANR